jgi:hypothetical protein
MGDILHIRSRTDSLSRALKHIDDPVARKLVILSKRDRRPILEPFFVIDNGKWTQRRLTDERTSVQQHRERQSEKGKAGAQAKALKKQGRHQAAAKSGLACGEAGVQPDASSLLHTHTPEDKSSGGDLQTFDAETIMWRHGKLYLTSQGVKADKAGSLLGKWKRDHGAEAVIVALGKAQREGAIDPVSFIEGCFNARQKETYDPDRITV